MSRALSQGAFSFIAITSFHRCCLVYGKLRLPLGNLGHTQSRVARPGRTRLRRDSRACGPQARKPTPLTVCYHGFSGRRTGRRGDQRAWRSRPRAARRGARSPQPTGWVASQGPVAGPRSVPPGLGPAGREVRAALALSLPSGGEACARKSRLRRRARFAARVGGVGWGGAVRRGTTATACRWARVRARRCWARA